MATESVVRLHAQVDPVDALIQERARAFCLSRRVLDPEWDGDFERILKAGRELWAGFVRLDARWGTTGNRSTYLDILHGQIAEYSAIIAEHAPPACVVLPYRRREG